MGRTKSQVKKAVQAVAKDLVELYAARQQSEGFVYGPDTVWQKEFEEMFPLRRRKIRSRLSRIQSMIWKARRSWTV